MGTSSKDNTKKKLPPAAVKKAANINKLIQQLNVAMNRSVPVKKKDEENEIKEKLEREKKKQEKMEEIQKIKNMKHLQEFPHLGFIKVIQQEKISMIQQQENQKYFLQEMAFQMIQILNLQ